MMDGAMWVPISFQFYAHFTNISIHMYPNVETMNIIIGMNSQKKST
jgi:hypothetical protein